MRIATLAAVLLAVFCLTPRAEAQVIVAGYAPAPVVVAPAPVVTYRPVVPVTAYSPVVVAPTPVVATPTVVARPVVTTRYRPILGGTVSRVRYYYSPVVLAH